MPPTKTARRVRFVKNPHPGATRQGQPKRAPEPRIVSRRSESGEFPGWRDLASDNERNRSARFDEGRLAAVPMLRMAALIAALAAVVTLYVGHVHATQQLADRVQALTRENLTLHLHHNQVKGQFDQATAPSVIYRRARALGLSEAVPNGFPIHVQGVRR